VGHYHVLMEGEAVVGRINLFGVAGNTADLGFRIAEKAAGQGLAQYAVRQICELAVAEYGLTTLRAAAAIDNVGSRTVLARTGFAVTGQTVLNGRPAVTFARALT
jgi:[ribosomal protein S5]-alanine N-acetyltransferase